MKTTLETVELASPARPGTAAARQRRSTSAPREERFLNRELSWIEFDRRVLELAADSTVPLLDRIRFCAIASSNLDEFFAVRMAELAAEAAAGITRTAPDGRTSAQTLAAARTAIVAFQEAQDELWATDLRPALAAAGIKICAPAECRPRELRSLTRRLEQEVFPLLTPIAVGPVAPFPHVHSLGISLCLTAPDAPDGCFVLLSVPRDVPRFLELDAHGTHVAVEDALVHFSPSILGGDGTRRSHGIFRLTRDADVSVSRDADDLLVALETELQRRRFGDVVRLELDARAPAPIADLLLRELAIERDAVYETSAPLGLVALAELAASRGRRSLKRKPWRPVTTHPFSKGGRATLLSQIRRGDLLAHHPYDAYSTSVERFVAASQDPKVAALKATVYRTGSPSRTVASLVDAADAGKEAVCLVELRARFDERRNIEWSRALDRAGVRVVYGDPALKIHAKLCLLVRREQGTLRRYAHIGTGNYHASNASSYEDFSFFTADEEITADVADVFNAVTGQTHPTLFRKLLVAPWFLRDGLRDEISRVVAAAQAGQRARIRIKVNGLVDPEIVDALCAASAAGADVQIVVRGICVLRPGVVGTSEPITVRSVLGPFLEHSRIFSFEAGEEVSTWIGSADLMPRNLDRRVEVLVPIEDARLRAQIDDALDALLADTRFAWELGADGIWARVVAADGAEQVSAQELLMQRALKRAKKRS